MDFSIMFKVQIRSHLPLIAQLITGCARSLLSPLGASPQNTNRLQSLVGPVLFQTSSQQNLETLIRPLTNLTFSELLVLWMPLVHTYMFSRSSPKHSFQARISHAFCWNYLSIIQALKLGLRVIQPLPSWKDFPCRPSQSLLENQKPQREGIVNLYMFTKPPGSPCKFSHLLLKTYHFYIPWSIGRSIFC